MEDTKIGGPSGKFPATRWSAIVAARSTDAAERTRGLETVVEAYWKPIYKYVRIRWNKSNEDAKDLTQEFFSRLIEKNYLGDFDPSKARLRTFLRVCVDHFLGNEAKAATRLKRGDAAQHISLDFDAAEAELRRASQPLGGGVIGGSRRIHGRFPRKRNSCAACSDCRLKAFSDSAKPTESRRIFGCSKSTTSRTAT